MTDDYAQHKKYEFFFHLSEHAFDTYNKTLGKEIKFSPLDSMAMFGMFQILGDSFDFDNYSKLNITL